MIDETVRYRRGYGRAVEYPAPVGERSIGRYDRRPFFVPLTDNLEEKIRAGLAQRQIADLVLWQVKFYVKLRKK